MLASLAPQGIDPLREALAKIPTLDEEADAPDPEDAEAALERAREAHDAARIARETASEKLADLRTEATRAETALCRAEVG